MFRTSSSRLSGLSRLGTSRLLASSSSTSSPSNSRLGTRLEPLGTRLRTFATINNTRETPVLHKKYPPANQKDVSELDNVTTLPNGIRVASEALPGVFSGIGVYIDAGSRYETANLRGVSHIIDRLAFSSTKNRTSEMMMKEVEMLGGNVQCASSREAMMYQAATFNRSVPQAIELLADTIRNPSLTPEEIQAQVETAGYEISEIWSKPDLILPELLHMAAFKDQTLGNPLLCPQDRLKDMNANVIQQYRDFFYRPERIVVAFAGVDHRTAVNLASEFFGDMKAKGPPPLGAPGVTDSATISASTSPSSTSPSSPEASLSGGMPSPNPNSSHPFKFLSRMISKSLSTSASNSAILGSGLHQENMFAPSYYTGGFLSLPPQPVSRIPNQPNFSVVHIAFEGLPIGDPDIYALAVAQTLLGGGSSFSAGGPGKGMYSRLYTGVLNHYPWVEACQSFNHSYTDSGLFGISGACLPGKTGAMVDVMCSQLRSLIINDGFGKLQLPEVNRAKNQLRSSLLMNLESRMVELEDLGRQIQVYGKKVSAREMCEKIEALTVDDVRRVASKVLTGQVQNPGNGSGAPTVVLQEAEMHDGKVVMLEWGEIQERIAMWGLGKQAKA